MPSKSEKQKNFFGAVMGAKKGQKGSSPEAKKVAKEMPKKEIKKFLKTEEEDEQRVDYAKKATKHTPSPEEREKAKFDPSKLKGKGKLKYKKGFDLKKEIGRGLGEEDEQSVVKQMKKGGGKAAFEGPNVKDRKHFAPATQTHKAKKGKGSYDRKKSFDEDEEDESTNEAKKCKDEARCEVYGEPMKKKREWVNKQLLDDEDEEKACWKGYKKKGMKKKGDKTVNNCVKESNSILNFLEAIMTNDHAEAHKSLKDAINKKLQLRIAAEIDNPLF